MARKKRDQDRKELLAPDPFQKQGGSLTAWLEKNIRWLLVGLVAVLAGIVLYEVVRSQNVRSSAEATRELGDVLEAYREAQDPAFARTATSADVIDARRREAAKKLAAFREAYPETGPARLALLYEANLAKADGELEEAVKLFDRYLESAGPEDPLRFVALENAGYALEDMERYEEALEYFRRLESLDFYRNYALKHQARVLKEMGRTEDAIEALEELLDSEPSTFLENYAEGELKVLRS